MKNILASSALFLAVLLGTQLGVSAQIVANGDFEANAAAFTGFPGYVNTNGNPAIADWVANSTSSGINTYATQGEGHPFAPTGYRV